jgi:putative ABC transport system permease protein
MRFADVGRTALRALRSGTRGTTSLTVDDERAIRQQVALVERASANVDAHTTVIYQNQNWFTQIRGVEPDYFDIRRWIIEEGGGFSADEVRFAAKVCLIGRTVVANLFGEQDPLGQVIRVQKVPCRVIGVLASKGPSATGQDQDDVVIMPVTTVQKTPLRPSKTRSPYSCASVTTSKPIRKTTSTCVTRSTSLGPERHPSKR